MAMHHDYVSDPVRSLVKGEWTELSGISENRDVLQDVLRLLTIKPPRWKNGGENKGEWTELSGISENRDVLQDVLRLLTIKPPWWKNGGENN